MATTQLTSQHVVVYVVSVTNSLGEQCFYSTMRTSFEDSMLDVAKALIDLPKGTSILRMGPTCWTTSDPDWQKVKILIKRASVS